MMNLLPFLGKKLIIFGLAIAAIGLVLTLSPKIPWLGRLPGDFLLRKERFTLYFPLTTCVIISIIVTIVLSVLRR